MLIRFRSSNFAGCIFSAFGLIFVLSGTLACTITKSHRSEQEVPTDAPPGSGLVPQGAMFYGAVVKCLENVERHLEDKQFMRWQYSCSPIMENASRDELRSTLANWHQQHCPQTVPYPMPASENQGRRCSVHAAQVLLIESPRAGLEDRLRAATNCASEDDEISVSPGAKMPTGMLTCEFAKPGSP